MDGRTTAWARRAIEHVARSASGGALDRSLRITLNFHPDRPVDGATVLQRLAQDGCYRSQFETGTSNGGLTAHPGGDRWRWERRMFGHAYDDAPPRSDRSTEPWTTAGAGWVAHRGSGPRICA